MEEGIKELRVKIDGLAQLTKELKPNSNEICNPPEFEIEEWRSNSKEIEKAVDSLYLAKAWLGKLLGELGTENPYKSGYKTKEDIEPTADRYISGIDPYDGGNTDHMLAIVTFEDRWKTQSHIEKVDWLRTEISFISSYETGSIFYFNEEMYPNANRYFNNYMDYMSEARFWLGFELERIKNN
jgi:hypothetical protein